MKDMDNMPITNGDYLNLGLNQLSISTVQDNIDKFLLFMQLLKNKNEDINLTAIIENKEIIIKHILDSVSIASKIDFNYKRVLDMGTGGGLPGIPLKILFPDMEIVFVDSSKKKIKIVDEFCQALNFSKFKTEDTNIENLGHDIDFRNIFDFVLCRAVAPMNILIEYGIPLLKLGGELILYKGPLYEQEVENSTKALNELRAKIKEYVDIILPFSDIKRHLVLVEKIGITPDRYPRRIGIPKKRPL